MKIKFLTFIVLLLALLPLQGQAQQVKGDVNGDGMVNVTDVTTVVDIILRGGGGSVAPDGVVAVDLGLPSGTLWAPCNVGATKPWEYGGYYAWGETKEKNVYDWSIYKWCNGSKTTLTKYCTDSNYGTVDGKTVLAPEDDVANMKWDGWRMPTREELDELLNECTYEWTTLNGVNGRKLTGPNGNSIFLPAAGYYWDDNLHNAGNSGYYWSSTQDPSASYGAFRLLFRSGDEYWISTIDRFYGLTVRPVVCASLAVSIETFCLGVGGTSTVDITSGNGSYSVESSDAGVAAASLSGTTITVTGVGEGTAIITVKDTKTGQTAKIIVGVFVSNGQENGHNYVDLGLPSGTLWALCNVGATEPWEYGGYYAWGETEEKDYYDWSTYKWCEGSENTLTKYCTNSYYGTEDYKILLDPEDDVAHLKWGDDWRMPTSVEQDELHNYCTSEWTTLNGVKGMKFTGPNGNCIFLPAAGSRDKDTLESRGSHGAYWSSSYFMSLRPWYATLLNFGSGYLYLSNTFRTYGLTVRPVRIISSLQVASSELSLFLDEQVKVDITSGNGSYTVQSSDANVATATLSDGKVLVTAKGAGQTFVTVTDLWTGIKATIEVTVVLSKKCPNDNHPHWIDLGLPSGTQWRCCNEGVDEPEGFGGYFEFWDRAYTAPSKAQIEELCSKCSYSWTTQNGVRGGKFTGPNGGSIFLPAAGHDNNSGVGSHGYYWSSTPDGNNPYFLYFTSGDHRIMSFAYYYKCSVRPVR